MKRDTEKRDAEIVELIHKNSIRLLAELGVEILWDDARELLQKNGVRVEGKRAYFTEKQVMDALDAATKEFTIYARNSKYNVNMNTEDLYMTPGYGSPFICEADGTLRSATLDDFLKLAVIVQESDEFAINGGILAQPSDIAAEISAEAMVYATICRSDKTLFTVCGGAVQAENIVKMSQVIFGEDITNIPCTINLISPMSPLILTQNTLESMEVYARNGQPLAICPASMAGATGPISVIGNVSLSNAEFLASNTYAQMVRPGTPVIYAFAATVSDMANMQVYNSNPGFLKLAKYGALMSKKYGLPCRSGGGMADAPGFTAQAGVESAMNMFESFSQKANLMMHATGSVLSFNAVSYEKFILDIETYTRMMYYFGETPMDEDALAFDAVKEAVEEESGTFITLDHTYERCRIDPWYPQVSVHKKTDEAPDQALLQSIQKRLHTLLEGYQRPELTEQQRAALDDIMRGIGMKEEDIARV
ncbi:trimethylamine methyltransferase family protein [Lactonifactor longoviformis]|uniref:Trimethylamine---corrinoid protein Co-methyltransferase n=1 Tax=Lactonifactor longoviformis DSM 17459 TaxID=1122155 RepID=A0A1M5B4P0_9CLOT|nr:trimethylamine methyltransferase family protein [Lactonifactor longoviformis]SHF37474.1 trimethylamine---corrinoid protein Co-methyltransferase [Lactonifactor longoviformis DSM 17459]